MAHLIPPSKLSLVVGILVGCTSGSRQSPRPANTRTDTVLVLFADTSLPFPRFQDSSRVLPRGSLRPSPDVPLCHDSPLDTREWPRQEVSLRVVHLRWLSLQLPPDFDNRSVNSDRMVIWESRPRAPHKRPATRFRLFMGDEHGYPVASIGGGARQKQLAECRLTVQGRPIAVALFTAVSGRPSWPDEYYLTAVWDLGPEEQVQILAVGQDSTAQTVFLAVLRSLEFSTR